MFTKEEIELAPKVYEAIKKIAEKQGKKWEWKPEVGDWFLIGEEIGIVIDNYEVNPNVFRGVGIYPDAKKGVINWLYIHQVVPILHWETIEKILEDWGYTLFIGIDHENRANYYATIVSMDLCITKYGKARQEAVMRAIVKLGEEKQNGRKQDYMR